MTEKNEPHTGDSVAAERAASPPLSQNQPETAPEAIAAPEPISVFDIPLVQAAKNLGQCSNYAVSGEAQTLEHLTLALNTTLHQEQCADGVDLDSLLTLQSRVLDSVFNNILAQAGLEGAKTFDPDRLSFALQAQRQARHTIDIFKKYRDSQKRTAERENRNFEIKLNKLRNKC